MTFKCHDVQASAKEVEQQRLVEYVADSWDMADRLRSVPTPGHEGQYAELPLRAAYANYEPQGAEGRKQPLFETGLPTRYYIPAMDARLDLLEPSDRTSGCPYKRARQLLQRSGRGRSDRLTTGLHVE
ncbi:MAG: DUF427 domain-containing protein [Trueperaceae bacterium]